MILVVLISRLEVKSKDPFFWNMRDELYTFLLSFLLFQFIWLYHSANHSRHYGWNVKRQMWIRCCCWFSSMCCEIEAKGYQSNWGYGNGKSKYMHCSAFLDNLIILTSSSFIVIQSDIQIGVSGKKQCWC